ncbi:MAG TPA: FtsQ-type POTRA domain-containing protein [Mycobacteriales bacterium]|nr:FtsQ-type POTRA domain-containing protein [Mycobacteriales bacterium]
MSRAVLPAGPRLQERARAARRARRLLVVRRAGWLVAGLAPFGLAAWVLLGSSWLVVDKVVVTGEGRVTAEQVRAAARVRLGSPLARVDTGAVAARVRALGPVATVTVSRSWPGTLRVAVTEREPVVAVGRGTAWTLYDDTGTQLGSATAVPAGLVQLAVAHPGPADPSTRAALTVLRSLPPALRGRVAVVRATSPEQVGMVLRDGRRVVWGGTSDARAKASALLALLRLKGGVYDVSSPTVVTRR